MGKLLLYLWNSGMSMEITGIKSNDDRIYTVGVCKFCVSCFNIINENLYFV